MYSILRSCATEWAWKEGAISRLNGLYQILHVRNIGKLAKTTQLRSFCHIKSKWSQPTPNTHTHTEWITPLAHVKSVNEEKRFCKACISLCRTWLTCYCGILVRWTPLCAFKPHSTSQCCLFTAHTGHTSQSIVSVQLNVHYSHTCYNCVMHCSLHNRVWGQARPKYALYNISVCSNE